MGGGKNGLGRLGPTSRRTWHDLVCLHPSQYRVQLHTAGVYPQQGSLSMDVWQQRLNIPSNQTIAAELMEYCDLSDQTTSQTVSCSQEPFCKQHSIEQVSRYSTCIPLVQGMSCEGCKAGTRESKGDDLLETLILSSHS